MRLLAFRDRWRSQVGFVVIDQFLPEELARAVKAENLKLYESSEMQEGATTGGSERVGISHRPFVEPLFQHVAQARW